MGRADALTAHASPALAATLLTIGAILAACSGPPPRPQLLVTVHSDVALPAQLDGDTTLSAAGSIDRVRVEIFASDGSPTATRDFVVSGTSSFPVSFGVEAPAGSSPLIRVTGFRAAWEKIDDLGQASVEPGVSITRLAQKSVVALDRIDIALHGDCFGAPADLTNATTCVDAARRSVPATTLDDAPPAIGSWPGLRDVECSGTAPSGALCIPGGLSDIGDPALDTVDLVSDLVPNSPRAVMLSPFYLDRTETTVAQLRSMFSAGKLPGAAAPVLSSADAQCNYSLTPARSDNHAVRCVSYETALAVCKARGGSLPTAAQWEHAARGRGRGYRYPWGNAEPTCCAAALAGGDLGCTPKTAVGSYATPASCSGIADISRDGVLDLAGGVREWVLDAAVPFNQCMKGGLATDPTCTPADHPGGSTKGGSIATPLTAAEASLRRGRSDAMQDVGFRCAF
jgi:formylglycine-generating enzyme required for sulfatase activity